MPGEGEALGACFIVLDFQRLVPGGRHDEAEHLSPFQWDNVVLYGQYILDRKLIRRHRRSMKVALSVYYTNLPSTLRS